MFTTCSDTRIKNKPLPYHMSTSTFSNPIFNPRFEQNPGEALFDEMVEQSKCSKRSKLHARLLIKKKCANFCDSIAFSIRSKMFVLELNLERKLHRLKKFANNHFTWINLQQNKKDRTNWDSKAGSGKSGTYGSKFWRDFDEAPSSRNSLIIQQKKILHRLEQVVQAKRYKQEHLFDPDNADKSENSLRTIVSHIVVADSTAAASPAWTIGKMSHLATAQGYTSPSASKLKFGYISAQARSVLVKKSRCGYISAALHARGKVYDRDQLGGSKKLCIICYTNPPNIITIPCQHHEICSDCFTEMIYLAVKHSKYPLKCVLCRQKVERIKCSRKLLLSVIDRSKLRLK